MMVAYAIEALPSGKHIWQQSACLFLFPFALLRCLQLALKIKTGVQNGAPPRRHGSLHRNVVGHNFCPTVSVGTSLGCLLTEFLLRSLN